MLQPVGVKLNSITMSKTNPGRTGLRARSQPGETLQARFDVFSRGTSLFKISKASWLATSEFLKLALKPQSRWLRFLSTAFMASGLDASHRPYIGFSLDL